MCVAIIYKSKWFRQNFAIQMPKNQYTKQVFSFLEDILRSVNIFFLIKTYFLKTNLNRAIKMALYLHNIAMVEYYFFQNTIL